jgi:predicted dehydrogenase
MENITPDDRLNAPSLQDRRSFLKFGTIAGMGAAFTGLEIPGAAEEHRIPGEARTNFKTRPIEQVRIGFVGVGSMGMNHLGSLMNIDGVRIKAVCDIVPGKVKRALDLVVKGKQPKPASYAEGPTDFQRMCETEELDLVYAATPWEWHVPVCLAAMKNGKHVATEVPAAMNLDDCWKLVETAEKYEKHCQMLENCCYDRIELMTLHMVRKGVLGEILHAEAGYLHDGRNIINLDDRGAWRRAWLEKFDGNLYPTHGLGPVAQCMNINRGDALDYVVSMSSPSRGIQEYAAEHFGLDSPQAKRKFMLGDVNSSLIKTKLGKTIILIFNISSPRPYSRVNLVQGTKGIAQKWPDRIYLEGKSKKDEWDDFEKFAAEYEHPLWKGVATKGAGRTHGGMDYLVNYRLIAALHRGEPLDQDVYDAAAWSSIVGASIESVAHGSKPIAIPDFTRGKWKTSLPLGIIEA